MRWTLWWNSPNMHSTNENEPITVMYNISLSAACLYSSSFVKTLSCLCFFCAFLWLCECPASSSSLQSWWLWSCEWPLWSWELWLLECLWLCALLLLLSWEWECYLCDSCEWLWCFFFLFYTFSSFSFDLSGVIKFSSVISSINKSVCVSFILWH